MTKWQCTVCGYIYDPEEGDSDGGIPAGTPFEKLPDDWVCPICGAEFETFNPKVRYNSHICSRRAKKGKQL